MSPEQEIARLLRGHRPRAKDGSRTLRRGEPIERETGSETGFGCDLLTGTGINIDFTAYKNTEIPRIGARFRDRTRAARRQRCFSFTDEMNTFRFSQFRVRERFTEREGEADGTHHVTGTRFWEFFFAVSARRPFTRERFSGGEGLAAEGAFRAFFARFAVCAVGARGALRALGTARAGGAGGACGAGRSGRARGAGGALGAGGAAGLVLPLGAGLALLLAAVASAVSEPVRAVEAVAFEPVPPPLLLLAANAPPVIAKTKAMNATTVVGFMCLRTRWNIVTSL